MSEDLIPISVWWDINSCPVPTDPVKIRLNRSFAPAPHFRFRPSVHMATTTVLWDMDSCPLPDSFSPSLAGRSIRSALKNSGYLGPVTITAMSNLHLNPRSASLLEALFSSGIHISNIFGYCLSQLFGWRMSAQPPATLMLICGDIHWKCYLNLFSAYAMRLNRSFAPAPHFRFRPSVHMATTTVLWDMDSCPLPDSFSPSLAGRSIRSALKNSGYLGPVTITAMSNLHLNPRSASLLEVLFSSGIHISNIFGYCLSQLFGWRMSVKPPATLMLICGDTTLEMLSEPLFRICDEGFTILVAHPGRKPDSFSPSLAGRSIRSALKNSGYLGPVTITAMSNLHLNPRSASLLEALFSSGIHISNIFGCSADDKDEALEYKCREMGYVSCEMCEFSGFSLEDLTTHFSSDEHLEEVSYHNPLDKHSSSTSAGNERETKTEHVGEQETSCAPRGTKRAVAHIVPSDL
ncbi:unnamed protein product [Brassica rapa]|uniref:NYN domain-containing protein n=2 Tax=Brassica TaxID=3705 RepID=A0A8D9G163_BRACM|nr:unnamed protein product [Brassica rapa]